MLFPVVGKTKAPHIVGLLFALESTMTFNKGKSKTTPQNDLEWLTEVFLQKSRKSFARKMRVKLPAAWWPLRLYPDQIISNKRLPAQNKHMLRMRPTVTLKGSFASSAEPSMGRKFYHVALGLSSTFFKKLEKNILFPLS